ncbi:hypothetical protein D3C84_810060 [compost metagenome]
MCIIPDLVRSAIDAVFLFGLRGGIGEDRFFRDRLEQPEANHRRGDARGETRVRVHRAVAELGDLQCRLAQLDFGAVLETHRHRRVINPNLAFRNHAGHRHVLELAAVDRLGHDTLLLDDFGVGW